MEFYADTSALLLSIFWILGVIFAYYDRMMTNHSISKKLFYFEGIKGNNFDQLKIIKELVIKKEKLEREKERPQENNIITFGMENNENTNDRILKNNFIRRNNKSQLKNENEEIKEKDAKKNLIDFSSYNIFEVIGSLKIFFCKSKKFKNKINLIEQANSLINDKLDVVFYIRNMILFELINKIYLENKNILNFLSRPIIYCNDENEDENKDEKSEFRLSDKKTNTSLSIGDEINEKKVDEKKDLDILQYFDGELYKTAYKLNTTVLSEKLVNLILHPDKTRSQKKLISYLKEHLKGV